MRLLITMVLALMLNGCNQQQKGWQGYNEGQFIYVSSDSNGTIKKINVSKGQLVQAGDTMVTFDPKPASDELEKANADVQAARANKKSTEAKLALAAITLKRYTNLLNSRAINRSEYDQVNSDYLNAQAADEQMAANLKAAEATVAKYQWSNQQKTLVAPTDSLVFDTYYLEGEFVEAGQPVVALLSPKNIKAIFYLAQPEVAKIKVGSPVSIYCDGCNNPIRSKISYISAQAEFTPPVIYSNETKASLVFRVEAVPVDQTKMELKPGQPVTVVAS